MNDLEAREKAINHWQFIEGLEKGRYSDDVLTKMKYLYINAFVHGAKHEREDKDNDREG